MFAVLKDIFGEDRTRIVIQHESVKKAIDGFDNLSPKTIQGLKIVGIQALKKLIN